MLSPQQAKITFLFNLNVTTYQRCVPLPHPPKGETQLNKRLCKETKQSSRYNSDIEHFLAVVRPWVQTPVPQQGLESSTMNIHYIQNIILAGCPFSPP